MGEKGALPKMRAQTSLDEEAGASDAVTSMPPPDSTSMRPDGNAGQRTAREKK